MTAYKQLIPGYILEMIGRYAERHKPTNGFAKAVTANDLQGLLRWLTTSALLP